MDAAVRRTFSAAAFRTANAAQAMLMFGPTAALAALLAAWLAGFRWAPAG
ncbi:MAG: hypothetical protein JO276_08670 [Sphingomonadaceae bacterium]|nr:hypothetical protein [Sphingomonadaceae bacterium]